MAVRRFFYITQDSLVVWRASGSHLREEIGFHGSDEGYRLFSAYLERAPRQRSMMLVDVIEEEFDTDSMPKLSAGDRKSLIERRLAKRFPVTPYRMGVTPVRSRRETDQFNVVYSAITNNELIDPWLEIISRHKTPLVGLSSVPLLGAELLSEFKKPADNSLFVTKHQGGRLRQTFIKSGQPISARLSKVAPTDSDDFGPSLVAEIVQSRKYLERARLLSPADKLDVYLVAAEDIAKRAFVDNSGIEFRAHIIDPGQAAKQLGVAGDIRPTNIEFLYLARCIHKRPKYNYATRERLDYSRLLDMRHAAIGIAVTAAVACSVASGVLLTGALMFRDASQTIRSQVAQMEETYRREHAEFEPIRADSHEMKLVVDSGEFILRNTLPVEWVMGQIGRVMDEHADMHIDDLNWQIESTVDENGSPPRRGRNDRPAPVPISAIAAVTANLSGEIHPYDGNLLHAFAKIDELAKSLQQRTDFDRVAVAEYPLDARPGVPLSGEIRREGDKQTASFSLSLTLSIDDEAG